MGQGKLVFFKGVFPWRDPPEAAPIGQGKLVFFKGGISLEGSAGGSAHWPRKAWPLIEGLVEGLVEGLAEGLDAGSRILDTGSRILDAGSRLLSIKRQRALKT